jgi:hypothetical protein
VLHLGEQSGACGFPLLTGVSEPPRMKDTPPSS